MLMGHTNEGGGKVLWCDGLTMSALYGMCYCHSRNTLMGHISKGVGKVRGRDHCSSFV